MPRRSVPVRARISWRRVALVAALSILSPAAPFLPALPASAHVLPGDAVQCAGPQIVGEHMIGGTPAQPLIEFFVAGPTEVGSCHYNPQYVPTYTIDYNSGGVWHTPASSAGGQLGERIALGMYESGTNPGPPYALGDPVRLRIADSTGPWQLTSPVTPLPVTQVYGCGCESDPAARPTNLAGDPVNTATGAYADHALDLSLPGAGVTFTLTRNYTSLDTTVGVLGQGWTHTHEATLTIAPNGDVTYRSGDGQQSAYTRRADGTFQGGPGVRAQLQATTDAGGAITGYLRQTRDHLTQTFSSTGALLSTFTSQGTGLTYQRVPGPALGAGEVASVTDAAGRSVNFTYADVGPGPAVVTRLIRVTLPDGRYMEYSYDQAGQLADVRDTRGGHTAYLYDPQLRLTQITDQLGRQVVQNTYGTTGSDVGRVVSQLDAAGNQTSYTWTPMSVPTDVSIPAGTGTAVTTDARGGTWTDRYVGYVLVTQTDPLGRKHYLGYDEGVNLASETDALGRTTSRTHDTAGRVTSETTPGGGVRTYNYDSHGDLTSIEDPLTRTTTLSYDAYHQLTGITDAAGKSASASYTPTGQLATSTDRRGKLTSYGYDSAGNLTSVTLPTGRTTTMTYDSSGRMVSRTDPRGNVTGATPAVHQQYTTTMGYDPANHQISLTSPLGRASSWVYDLAGELTSQTGPAANAGDAAAAQHYTYDPRGLTLTSTDQLSHTTHATYDAVGNRTSMTSPEGRQTSWTYDLAGEVTSSTRPRGNAAGADPAPYTTSYTYDPAGEPTGSSVPDPAGGAAITTSATYDPNGRVLTTTDPLGHTVTRAYDLAGEPTSVTDPLGHTQTRSYDLLGRVTGYTDALQRTWSTRYDPEGHPVSSKTPLLEETTRSFDDDGRLQSVTSPRGNAAGADPAAFTTTYAYDPAGHLTGVTDPLQHTTTTSFDADGFPVSQIDQLTHETRASYTPAGQLATLTLPDAIAQAGTGVTPKATRYRYDDAHRLITRTDALDHTTTYGYDQDGLPTTRTDPLGRTWATAHDLDGNATLLTTPDGTRTGAPAGMGQITTGFDALDRMISRSFADQTPNETYSYDQGSRPLTATTGTGTAAVTDTAAYDAANRITATTRSAGSTAPAGPYTDSFAYTYTPADELASRTTPAGRQSSYTYDPDGRLTQTALTGTLTPGVTSFSYDQDENLLTTTLPGATGVQTTRSYDDADRMIGLTSTRAGTPISSYQLTLDPVGNLTRIAETRSGTTRLEDFSYDEVNRVTVSCLTQPNCVTPAVYPPEFIQWRYDLSGNRTSEIRQGNAASREGNATTAQVQKAYTYDAADELTGVTKVERAGVPTGIQAGDQLQQRVILALGAGVETTTSTNYTSDLRGNQTRVGGETATFDLLNRRTSTTQPAGWAGTGSPARTDSYTYAASGGMGGWDRLTHASTSGAASTPPARSSWDDLAAVPALTEEHTPAGTLLRAWSDTGGLPELDQPGSGGSATYLLPDATGSVGDEVAATDGTLTASHAYEPFGLERTPAGDRPSLTGQPARFAGGIRDDLAEGRAQADHAGEGTHLGAREYDPNLGRFSAQDPLQGAADPVPSSVYAYVGDRPGVYQDPSGMDACKRLFGLCEATSETLSHPDAFLGEVAHSTTVTLVNIGRGATMGGTDQIANLLSPGASCTVTSTGVQAQAAQSLGTGAALLLGDAAIAKAGKIILGALRVRALAIPIETGGAFARGERGYTVGSKVFIRPGMSALRTEQTIMHEAVHRALYQTFGRVNLALYDNSVLARVLEETLAEAFATGSLQAGARLALRSPYVVGVGDVVRLVSELIGVGIGGGAVVHSVTGGGTG